MLHIKDDSRPVRISSFIHTLARAQAEVALVVLLRWGWGRRLTWRWPRMGRGRKQNTASLCSSAFKDSPSCDSRTVTESSNRSVNANFSLWVYGCIKTTNRLSKSDLFSSVALEDGTGVDKTPTLKGLPSIARSPSRILCFCDPPACITHSTA